VAKGRLDIGFLAGNLWSPTFDKADIAGPNVRTNL